MAALDRQFLFQLMYVAMFFSISSNSARLRASTRAEVTVRRLGGGDAVLLQPGAQPLLCRG